LPLLLDHSIAFKIDASHIKKEQSLRATRIAAGFIEYENYFLNIRKLQGKFNKLDYPKMIIVLYPDTPNRWPNICE